MNEVLLFTDGSVNNQTKTGFGACLVLPNVEYSPETLKESIIIKTFENTTSTKLEIQILLWALTETDFTNRKLIIYTDSQNIAGLSDRRKRFEKNDFRSKNNRQVANADLYKQFYQITDCLDFVVVKVQGHQQSNQKDEISRIFTLVDKAARKALRADNF